MQIGVINAAAVILTHVLAFLPTRIATRAILPPLTRPGILSLLALLTRRLLTLLAPTHSDWRDNAPPDTPRYNQFTCVTDPQVLSLLALTHVLALLPRHIVIAAYIMALASGAIMLHLTRRYSVYSLLLVQTYKY